MRDDPIVEEVRRLRQEYAKQLGYELHAMAEDLRRWEREHPERLVSFAPKPPRRKSAGWKLSESLESTWSLYRPRLKCCSIGGFTTFNPSYRKTSIPWCSLAA